MAKRKGIATAPVEKENPVIEKEKTVANPKHERKTLDWFNKRVGKAISCKRSDGETVQTVVKDKHYARKIYETQNVGHVFDEISKKGS